MDADDIVEKIVQSQDFADVSNNEGVYDSDSHMVKHKFLRQTHFILFNYAWPERERDDCIS